MGQPPRQAKKCKAAGTPPSPGDYGAAASGGKLTEQRVWRYDSLMSNTQLRDDFVRGPGEFLKKYALMNPGSTNFAIDRVDDKDVFVNEYLAYGGTPGEFAMAAPKSYVARAKTIKAKFDYLSMVGGICTGHSLAGSAPDVLRAGENMPFKIRGTSAVQISVDVKADPAALDVYFLPWKSNNTVTMQLGQTARYFITAAMSGCTFQVTGKPSAPIVSHANSGGETPDQKLTFMDGQLRKALETKLGALGKHAPVTRLQTGLWGTMPSATVEEVNYGLDPTNARPQQFSDTTVLLQRDKAQAQQLGRNGQKFKNNDLEVEEELDGDTRQITVAVAGWRPPGSTDWEFYYQVFADYKVTRRVYRHTYTVGKLGHKRKPLEKSIIGDFVFLVPGTKFWPNGTGWPKGTSGGVTMARSRSLSV
jgi:hypothetical protein